MSNILNIERKFGEHLFNFIKGRVSSNEDAQDIYQEVIFKILNKSQQLANSQSLKSWLFTIARNQIIDYYRARRSSVDIDSLPLSSVSHADEVNAYNELEGCLNGFIKQLPVDYRKVITLSEIQGESQKKISETLGLNYVTLRSKVQRGREKIKKMILDACLIERDTAGRFVDCTPRSTSSSCGDDTSSCGCRS